MHPVMRAAMLAAAVVAQFELAHAEPVDDCNSVGNTDLQLHGCTAYINMGNAAAGNLAIAHINRANIYAQRGQSRRAIEDYAAAMALDPTNPLAPYNRGNLYFDMQRYDLAIADYSRAISLDPSLGYAFLNRGLAHARRGEAEAAAADYDRAVKLDATILTQSHKLRHRVR